MVETRRRKKPKTELAEKAKGIVRAKELHRAIYTIKPGARVKILYENKYSYVKINSRFRAVLTSISPIKGHQIYMTDQEVRVSFDHPKGVVQANLKTGELFIVCEGSESFVCYITGITSRLRQ